MMRSLVEPLRSSAAGVRSTMRSAARIFGRDADGRVEPVGHFVGMGRTAVASSSIFAGVSSRSVTKIILIAG